MSVIVKGGGGKPEEEKTVTAGTSAKTVTPSDGKTIKKVTVNPTPSQSKTVTPSTSQQTVSPDSGKLLSQVIVKAMEDVTPEVTAQTPMISQILSNLGFTADSASGTNKQKLQTNNANLAKISDYLPHGAYVWKKLTAQGGDFVNFVVSDQSTAYPDGGTQDGYWYERVVEGITPEMFGYTKYAVDGFTLAVNSKNFTVAHSLEEVPKIAIIVSEDDADTQWHTTKEITIFLQYNYYSYIQELKRYSGSDASYATNAGKYSSNYVAPTTTAVSIYAPNNILSGKSYTLITMA